MIVKTIFSKKIKILNGGNCDDNNKNWEDKNNSQEGMFVQI